VEDLVQEDAQYGYADPPDAQEIDPIVGRLSRMEEVQRQFLDAMDGLSRAISLLADEANESRQELRERIDTLRELVADHVHDGYGNVRISTYLAKENTRRG
jgi:predicted HTH domain antitoxin